MSTLADYLLKSRTPVELSRELAAVAKKNAELLNRVHSLEHELFWMHSAERETNPVIFDGSRT